MRKTLLWIALSGLVMAPAAPALLADAVTHWNGIGVQATVTGGRMGPTGNFDLAVMHLAVHDAVVAIEGKFKPYHFTQAGASGSPEAATAAAAYRVLVNRFPAQAAALEAQYLALLLANSIPDTDPGIAVGEASAAALIALRASDGSFPNPAPPPYLGSTDVGKWRPTPPANAPFAFHWITTMTPFGLASATQFLAQPPPALTSGLYTRDYNEVKEYGSAMGSRRTAEQTELTVFWNANPVVMWNRTFREIATARLTDISDTARFFALSSMAMSDAGISSWQAKDIYLLWRPITAIRLGDTDGNPHTEADPAWTPLLATPPYPDYTSGANSLSGAATRILRMFYGVNEMEFTITSTNGAANPVTRAYTKLTDAAQEVVDVRIFQGIHFRFADVEARAIAEKVAVWTYMNHLRPVNGN